MHAHQNIIDQLDERFTYFTAITIIGNRLEPRLAILWHFLLYELPFYSSIFTFNNWQATGRNEKIPLSALLY